MRNYPLRNCPPSQGTVCAHTNTHRFSPPPPPPPLPPRHPRAQRRGGHHAGRRPRRHHLRGHVRRGPEAGPVRLRGRHRRQHPPAGLQRAAQQGPDHQDAQHDEVQAHLCQRRPGAEVRGN